MDSMVSYVIGSGVIVLGILMIRKWAMEKITRKLQYSLWLILPVYLFWSPFLLIKIPVSLEALPAAKYIDKTETYIGVSYEREAELPGTDGNPAKSQIIGKGESGSEEQIENITIQEQDLDVKTNDIYINLKKIWNIVRITISFLLFTFFVVTNIIFAIHLKGSRLFYKTVSLDSILKKYSVLLTGTDCNYDNFLSHKRHQVRLGIYLTNNPNAPFLFGKNIYLHPNMIENQEQMYCMVLHEFCHFKHGDLFWNILKYFCCALYWFNPFVWIAAHYIGRDCELACDESVIHMIGTENQKVYGLTLLQLVIEKQNNTRFIIGTTMKGRKSMIKERIMFISRTFGKNKKVASGCLIIAFLLTGCALIRPYAYVQTENFVKDGLWSSRETLDFSTGTLIEMPQTQEETGLFSTYFIQNNCYNPIKSDGNILYYGTAKCLQSIHLETGKITRLVSGNIRPGFLEKDYLYYIKYPAVSGDDAGIGRLNLTTWEDELIIPWADELWSCGNMLIEGNYLYLETGNTCEAYLLKSNETVKIEKVQNQIQNKIRQFGLSENELSGINFGFINSILDYSAFTILDRQNNELHIYNTDSEAVLTKKNCLGNVLICNEGIIYMTLDGDIILNPWNDMENNQILFSAAEEGYFVNYGTYDNTGLYVFQEKGNSVECKYITWEGKIENIINIPDVNLAIELNFSVFSDFAAYYKEGKINIIQLTN